MLKELRIKNLAIIDDLHVRFDKGLNVITGETGAGKSILVDSLGLALGSRAQSDLVRSGEKEAVIQAYFDVDTTHQFPDIGADISDELIIRRSISASGKSRAYINDTMVGLQSLAEIGRALVDIHGQHEHQSLLSVERHRDFLDSFGKLQEDKAKVGALYAEVEALKREAADLRQKERERAQRIDLLRFQVQEIDAASLKPGEAVELTERKTILSNLSRLNELAETAYAMIYGSEGACVEKLSAVLSKLKEMASIDHTVSDILSILESARPLVEDASVSLRSYRDRYDLDPSTLAEVEDRIELIRRLEKKYGDTVERIIQYRNEAGSELEGLELADERLDTVDAGLKAKEAILLDAAAALSQKRRNGAKKMEALVEKELKELAFANATFVIDIRQEAVSASGFDKVEFLFSANQGEPPRPLAKVASGGELSRVMLALKSVLAVFDRVPVMVFDEVDAGIGGKTAESVGTKLRTIAESHQVLCTTHLPQIASKGDFHLKTEKGQKQERTFVEIRELSGKERLQEIARMLSGTITEVSLRHAKELLEGTR